MKTRVIWTKNEVFGHVPKLPLLLVFSFLTKMSQKISALILRMKKMEKIKLFKYVGESSRSLYEHGVEHLCDLDSKGNFGT